MRAWHYPPQSTPDTEGNMLTSNPQSERKTASRHVKPGPRLTRKQWEHLKLIVPTEPRYVHVSCEARMVLGPNNSFQPFCTSNRWRRQNGQPIPPTAGLRGVTFDAGRNKAKRERRAAIKASRS